eukprot:1118341-Prymnesium_polylepis.1
MRLLLVALLVAGALSFGPASSHRGLQTGRARPRAHAFDARADAVPRRRLAAPRIASPRMLDARVYSMAVVSVLIRALKLAWKIVAL